MSQLEVLQQSVRAACVADVAQHTSAAGRAGIIHTCAANTHLAMWAMQVLFCQTSAGFSLPPWNVRSPRAIAGADDAVHSIQPVRILHFARCGPSAALLSACPPNFVSC